MAIPPEAELAKLVGSVLDGQDLSTLSLKDVRSQMEERLGLAKGGLDGHRDKIKELVTAGVAERSAGGGNDGESSRNKKEDRRASKGGEDRAEKGMVKKRQAKMMTREEFEEKAEPFTVELMGKKVKVPTKQFSTGSSGWYYGGKIPVTIGGQEMSVQCQVNCAVVGSKEWSDK